MASYILFIAGQLNALLKEQWPKLLKIFSPLPKAKMVSYV